MLLVFWLKKLGIAIYIIPFFIIVIASNVTKVFWIFFKTLKILFLLFLGAVASGLLSIGSRSWGIRILLDLSLFSFLLFFGLFADLVRLLSTGWLSWSSCFWLDFFKLLVLLLFTH